MVPFDGGWRGGWRFDGFFRLRLMGVGFLALPGGCADGLFVLLSLLILLRLPCLPGNAGNGRGSSCHALHPLALLAGNHGRRCEDSRCRYGEKRGILWERNAFFWLDIHHGEEETNGCRTFRQPLFPWEPTTCRTAKSITFFPGLRESCGTRCAGVNGRRAGFGRSVWSEA